MDDATLPINFCRFAGKGRMAHNGGDAFPRAIAEEQTPTGALFAAGHSERPRQELSFCSRGARLVLVPSQLIAK